MHALQHHGELTDLLGRESAEELAGDAPEDGWQVRDYRPALVGEFDYDGAAVVWMLAPLEESLTLQAIKQPGHACGVRAQQRHQSTRAAVLPPRVQEQRRLLGGDIEGRKLTFQRRREPPPDLMEEGSRRPRATRWHRRRGRSAGRAIGSAPTPTEITSLTLIPMVSR